MAINAHTIIERNSLFRGLAPAAIAHVVALATRRNYENGAVVFMRIELVDSFAHIGGGKGGYWEDGGYEWYAGI